MLTQYGISVDLNLYSVFDQLPHGVTIQDKTGKLVYANTQAAILVGCKSGKEFLETPIEDILSRFTLLSESGKPTDLLALPGRLALENKRFEEKTLRFRINKTGIEYWSRVKSQPLFNENQEVTGVINIFDDLTSIKKTEHEYKFLAQMSARMARSFSYEDRLQDFAKMVVPTLADWCAIDILNSQGLAQRIAAAHLDPAKVELSKKLWNNYPPDPHTKSGFYHLIEKGEIELYSHITDKMLQQSARDEKHLTLLRELGLKSAAILPLIARGKKLGLLSFGTSESGRILREVDLPFLKKLTERVALLSDNARLYSALSREMEKQKIIKHELEKSEAKFESIFHASFIGMIIFDNEGRISEINEAVYSLFEDIPKKIIRKKIAEICKNLLSPIEKEGEMEWMSENGNNKILAYTVTTSIVPHLNLLVVRDITEERIEQKRREHFLGITSHELKSPLAAIKSISQLLQKKLQSTGSETQTYLGQISSKVDLLTRLVNDLLDVTRIRKGKLEFLYEIIDVPHLVEEVVKEIRYAAPGWDIEIKGSVEREVVTDRGRLSQVLRNLIWNAVKYAPTAKHCIVILEEGASTYKIAVEDFGAGIPKEEQQKIFNLYYRATNDKYQNSKGLGVGLFISSEIIKQMGGKLRIKSILAHGTTFYFSLPYLPKKR